jgi:hypothetical protein
MILIEDDESPSRLPKDVIFGSHSPSVDCGTSSELKHSPPSPVIKIEDIIIDEGMMLLPCSEEL